MIRVELLKQEIKKVFLTPLLRKKGLRRKGVYTTCITYTQTTVWGRQRERWGGGEQRR